MYGIILPRQKAQKGLDTLKKMGLLERKFEFKRTERGIEVPLIREPSDVETNTLRLEIGYFELRQAEFQPALSRPKKLQEIIEVPRELVSKLPSSFDIIGDIAIVEIHADLASFSSEIGKAILEINPHVRLVINKSGEVTGTFRTREFQRVAGSGTTETVYYEFSCRYKLDVATVYFNPRLSHERMRVAQQVKRDELVVDMFAGVGPYSILIAKSQPTSRIFSIDINPIAVGFLKQNAFENSVADRVIPLLGDARNLSMKEVHTVADRVVMNLPSEAANFIDVAIRTLRKEGGRLHFYQFIQRDTPIDSVKNSFRSIVEANNGNVESFEFCNVIREISPGMVQVAIDAVVTKDSSLRG